MEDKTQIKQVVEHFRTVGLPVTQDLLTEYCNRNKFPVLTLGQYLDWAYQYEYDERFTRVFPLVLAELQNLRAQPELASAADREETKKANEAVEVAIAKVLENSDVAFRTLGMSEVTLMMRNSAQIIAGALEAAENRANTSASEAIDRIAKEKLGGKLTLKSLIAYLRGE